MPSITEAAGHAVLWNLWVHWMNPDGDQWVFRMTGLSVNLGVDG
jgi:hypothetical protein